MRGYILSIVFAVNSFYACAQQLLILDRFNGNKIVNDSTITVYSSDPATIELTQYFTLKNNTDKPLALFLRKSINSINDSTIDYFCFGIKCWPDTYLTDVPDSIQPGASDSTFASHVVHFRRFENPPLPHGKSSITYTIFDNTSLPEPVRATVTVVYHLSGLSIEEDFQRVIGVWPNPAIQSITLRTNQIGPGNCKKKLQIYNSIGVQVEETDIWLENYQATYQCNSLDKGIYIGLLSGQKGERISFRFQVL